MDLPDRTPPPCPDCSSDMMEHRFYGIGEKRNGWYCQSCGAGGYQLGSKDEAIHCINTEAMAARFAIALLNK